MSDKFKIRVVLILCRDGSVGFVKETGLLPHKYLDINSSIPKTLKDISNDLLDVDFDWIFKSFYDGGYIRVDDNEICLIFHVTIINVLEHEGRIDWINHERILSDKRGTKENDRDIDCLFKARAV